MSSSVSSVGFAHMPMALSLGVSEHDKSPPSRAHWITPQKQLELLGQELRLIDIKARRIDLHQLHPIFTAWHTALDRLEMLPETIPPLPDDIVAQLKAPCPIFGEDKTVADTHALLLIPDGLTLNQFAEKIEAYGAANYKEINPLQFRFFCPIAREQYGDTPLEDVHWVLVTKDVIPGSRNKAYAEQPAMVAALNGNCGDEDRDEDWVLVTKNVIPGSQNNYELPSLNDMVAALFLHKIATGDSLYLNVDRENGNVSTFTRVQEMRNGYRLVVGGFDSFGICIQSYFDYDDNFLGVAALQKFPDLSGRLG